MKIIYLKIFYNEINPDKNFPGNDSYADDVALAG